MKKLLLLLSILSFSTLNAFNKNGTWPYLLIDHDKVRDELHQLCQSAGRAEVDALLSKTITDFVKTYNEHVTVFAYGLNYGTVVYHHPECDITQEIIDILKNKLACTKCLIHCKKHK